MKRRIRLQGPSSWRLRGPQPIDFTYLVVLTEGYGRILLPSGATGFPATLGTRIPPTEFSHDRRTMREPRQLIMSVPPQDIQDDSQSYVA